MEKIKISAKDYDEALTKALIELGTSSENIDIEIVDKGSKGFLGIGSRPCVIYASRKTENDLAAYDEKKPEKSESKVKEEVVKAKEPVIKPESVEKDIKVSSYSEDTEDELKPTRRVRKNYTEEEAAEIISSMNKFISSLFEKMDIKVSIDAEFDYKENEINVLLSSEEDMGIVIGKRGQTLDAIQYIVSLVLNKNTESYIRVKLDTENYRERRKEKLEILAKNVAYKVKKFRKSISLEPMNPYERRIIHSVLQQDNMVSTRSDGDEPFRYITVIPKNNRKNNNYNKRYNSYNSNYNNRYN